MSDTREKLSKLIVEAFDLCMSMHCRDCKEYDEIETLQSRNCQGRMFADYLLDNGVTVQEWIPVSERLPEQDGIYLTFNKKKQYEFHFFQRGKRMWLAIWEEDAVTHWMPPPQPPKGE